MAELFFLGIDNTYSILEEDLKRSYKKGYLVDVLPDGNDGGKEVILPKFIRISCPDLDVKTAREYLVEIKDVRRRRYSISSAQVDSIVSQGGHVVIDKSQLISKFIDLSK